MQYEGISLMVTYHPAALEGVQAIKKLHDELVKNNSIH